MGLTPIISVDGHVKASREGYRPYIEKCYLEAFDDWAASDRQRAERQRNGRDAGNIQPGLGDESQWNVDRRLSDLESQGVIGEVLFPNGVPFQENHFDDAGLAPAPEFTRAGRTAYNRWLADLCSQAPGRLCGQALVLFDDIEEAVADIYWAKEHGLGGVMMPGLYPGGTYFFDPALDPIWAAVQDTGLPISQHGGAGSPNYSPAGMAALLTLAYEQAFFSGRSLWQMIVGGVFDRFPGVKVVFVETQAYWIGSALQQFDLRVGRGDDWTDFARHTRREAHFSRLPSEYWDSNCYAGVSPFSPTQLPIEQLGSGYQTQPGQFAIRATNCMFGVDYPHFEAIYPSTQEQASSLAAQPTVTESDLRRVLFENAAEVYRFDLPALQPVIDRVGAIDDSFGALRDVDVPDRTTGKREEHIGRMWQQA